MSRRVWPWRLAVVALFTTAVSAAEPPRQREQRMPSVQVDVRLSHPSRPYSFGEDVLVEVEMHNRGAARVEVPWVPDTSEVVVRLASPGRPPREGNTMRYVPGVPSGAKRTQLEPGQGGVNRFSLQDVFGGLEPGRHALEVELRGGVVNLTTAPMPFEVAPRDVGAAALSVSPAAEPQAGYLAWLDAGTTPHRVLWREYAIHREHYALSATPDFAGVLAEVPGEVASLAVPSAPDGDAPRETWAAWTEGRALRAIRVRGGRVVREHREPLDADLDAVTPALVYPDERTEASPVSVLLASREGSPRPLLVGVDLAEDGKLEAAHRHEPAHPPRLVALAHLAPERRWVAWAEAAGQGKEVIRLMRWSRGGGFSHVVDVQEVSGRVVALTLSVASGHLWVGALVSLPQPTREQPHRAELSLVRARYAVKSRLDPVVLLLGSASSMVDAWGAPRVQRWKLDDGVGRAELALLPDGNGLGLVESGAALLRVATVDGEPVALPRPAGATRLGLFPISGNRLWMRWLDEKNGWRLGELPRP